MSDSRAIVSLPDGGIAARAPAKLNLFLEVARKRDDGYHELESLMVAVGLFDALTFHDDPSGRLTLKCDDPSLPTGDDNLVMRAANRLREVTGTPSGASMTLRKAVPAQAGLAGGSSDAATTLDALCRLWGLALSDETLDAIAADIGSDVTFFRHGPAAVCRGRGEQVEPLRPRTPLHFVLVCPTVGVRTADVYRQLVVPDHPRPIGPCLEAFLNGETRELGRALFNRLQPTAEALVPDLCKARDALMSLDPSLLDGHLMSGSGSAYFGLGRDLGAVKDAARQLETLGQGFVRVVTCGP